MGKRVEKLVEKGQRQAALGHWKRVCQIFHKAVDLEPWNIEHFLELGRAYCHRGKPAIGLQYFSVAMEMRPSDFRAWSHTGRALVDCWSSGNLIEKRVLIDALSYFREADRLNPGCRDTLFFIAGCHHLLGDWTLAYCFYSRALEIDPDYAEAKCSMQEIRVMNN